MKIYYSKKETKNLGNYENITIEMGIEDEVVHEEETADECFDRLKEFVNEKLSAQIPKLQLRVADIKERVSNLIAKDANKRNGVRELLATYNVTKIHELNQLELKEFNDKLKLIGEENDSQ